MLKITLQIYTATFPKIFQNLFGGRGAFLGPRIHAPSPRIAYGNCIKLYMLMTVCNIIETGAIHHLLKIHKK